jgi:hypothetical protein
MQNREPRTRREQSDDGTEDHPLGARMHRHVGAPPLFLAAAADTLSGLGGFHFFGEKKKKMKIEKSNEQ